MDETQTPSPATAATQDAANRLVDVAQEVANGVIDVGEEALGTVLDAVIRANSLLGTALEGLRSRITP